MPSDASTTSISDNPLMSQASDLPTRRRNAPSLTESEVTRQPLAALPAGRTHMHSTTYLHTSWNKLQYLQDIPFL